MVHGYFDRQSVLGFHSMEMSQMNPTTLKTWLQRGDVEKLENVVLEGRGARLLGEHSSDLRTRVFLKSLPNYLTKIANVHEAVSRGSLAEAKSLISDEPKKKLAYAKDPSGTPLLHKAVYYDHQHIVEWLIKNYPNTAQQKDKEGRIALHYCAACRDPETIWDILIEAGCDASVCDKKGNPAAYYLQHNAEIELPDTDKMAFRKISTNNESLDVKPSNIRIWIHNRDIGKLQQVLWEGHGNKLRRETSNNPRVKKFLDAVPFIMRTIKEIHTAVIKNDLVTFKKLLEYPVSPVILSSKDSNSHNVLHKAAGLGFLEMAREILEIYQPTVAMEDNNGRTPLHFAAAARDGGTMYDLLMEYGADGSKLDNKQKAAAFYKNRPSDVDMSTLETIPEAPRTAGTMYPKNWDWRILEVEEIAFRGMKKIAGNVDSAFGSAESNWKSLDDSNKVETAEIPDRKKDGDDLGDRIKEADEKQEMDAMEEALPEEDKKADESEERSSDDDVVSGHISEPVKEESVATENVTETAKTPNNEEKVNYREERNEPSTGDSGVDDPANDEDEIIVGEHEELPENELNDGSMAVDPEVDELLENGNMEQLATLVLNGEGRRLVGRQTSNPELQAFIDNVPSYMGKIHAVHMAAREGNLRDLQSALDRRKFAIARDGSSPHGATPLHVAVVFGNTAIIRYLAGRFPETTHATDLDGRTPLHYAATLADNGHYYNLLLHLGANPLVQDNFGQKADYYKENQNDLSHKKLLRDFGASETLADEMLTDKEDNQLDIPIFRPEEGRYLASSLGDPLIKGLTEVANARPKDPVSYLASYLYNFANKNKVNQNAQESDVLIIPERETGNVENFDDDNHDEDAGYPQSPNSDVPETVFRNPTYRDENGQSALHYAATRSYSKDGFFHELQEAQINIGFRDELYRTARDVAEQANITENVEEIDRWIVYMAARGETDKLMEILLEGYEHIIDAEDDGINIIDIAKQRGHEDTVTFLSTIPDFMASREEVHHAIRTGDVARVKKLLNRNGGKLLAVAKNITSRCSLHIAVLRENEEIVQFIAKTFPETLRITDNLGRTGLHYAMGLPSVEELSNILIKAGAKRIVKDLKSRQPSYYFMNKSEIERLQMEEESFLK